MSEVNTYNIKVHQGETWSMTATIKDDNDTAVDLTDYTAKMQIRNKPGGTLLKELATGGSGITINASTGEVALAMTATETAALAFREGVYDLYIESSSNTRTYLIKGRFTVAQRVTQ